VAYCSAWKPVASACRQPWKLLALAYKFSAVEAICSDLLSSLEAISSGILFGTKTIGSGDLFVVETRSTRSVYSDIWLLFIIYRVLCRPILKMLIFLKLFLIEHLDHWRNHYTYTIWSSYAFRF